MTIRYGIQHKAYMINASKLRETIDGCFLAYEATSGAGADAYNSSNVCHPMADGKYLQSLAVLRQSRLISGAQFHARASRACIRLEASALKCFKEGYCWGLGFPWRNLAKTEPFLITSAIITRGLLSCQRDGFVSAQAVNLLDKSREGLRAWVHELVVSVDDPGVTIACYSPGIREPIYNAAAYAYGTLLLLEETFGSYPSEPPIRTALSWIGSRRYDGLGWRYSPTSPIVDLLHQCYILNSLADAFSVKSIETAAAEMLGQFAGPCCFADAIRLVRDDQHMTEGRDIPWLRPLGNERIEVLPKPARLWSLGELLVLVSRLGLDGAQSGAWVRTGRLIAEAIVSRLSDPIDAEAQYPRHAMHAVHGLACYLSLLRNRARAPRAV